MNISVNNKLKGNKMNFTKQEVTNTKTIYRILATDIIPSLLKDVIPVSTPIFCNVYGNIDKCETLLGTINASVYELQEKELFFIKKSLDMYKLSYLLSINFQEGPENTKTEVIIRGVKA
jgi:hypothetical protein